MAWKDRHPGDQLPHDPSKKTIVVLGSGWAAISMLKALDTKEYNVVSIYPILETPFQRLELHSPVFKILSKASHMSIILSSNSRFANAIDRS
jgi:NADH dehydrogenase FAD-containing subunit